LRAGVSQSAPSNPVGQAQLPSSELQVPPFWQTTSLHSSREQEEKVTVPSMARLKRAVREKFFINFMRKKSVVKCAANLPNAVPRANISLRVGPVWITRSYFRWMQETSNLSFAFRLAKGSRRVFSLLAYVGLLLLPSCTTPAQDSEAGETALRGRAVKIIDGDTFDLLPFDAS
jgi:hypothetical protein